MLQFICSQAKTGAYQPLLLALRRVRGSLFQMHVWQIEKANPQVEKNEAYVEREGEMSGHAALQCEEKGGTAAGL